MTSARFRSTSYAGMPANSATSSHVSPTQRLSRLGAAERRHHVAGEPAQLFLELPRREALRPVDHVVLEARILRLDRLDAVDHLAGRATEPRLLLHAVAQ